MAYHMNSKATYQDGGQLSVYLRDMSGRETQVFYKKGKQGDRWITMEQELHLDRDYEVRRGEAW